MLTGLTRSPTTASLRSSAVAGSVVGTRRAPLTPGLGVSINVTFPFACTAAGVQDGTSVDADDTFCFGPWDPFFPGPPFQRIGGCTNAELDFDGSPYGLNWPGTFANPATDQRVHAEPITFTGPLFFGPPGLKNYQRVAFETDMADIEAINGTCDPTR